MELKNFRLPYRLWHWLNAIVISGLLETVFLRKTFLSYKANASIIKDELAKFNIDISMEASKTIGRAIRSPMWDWHYIFGFLLAALFIYRIIMHFTDRPFVPGAEIRSKQGKQKVVEIMYVIQYILVFMMIVSGLLLYFKKTLHLPKELAGVIKEGHEIVMYFFAVYVPMHIIGVFIAENQDQKGIVSNMIGGKSQ